MNAFNLLEFAAIAPKPFFGGFSQKIAAIESVAAFTGVLFKFFDPFGRNAKGNLRKMWPAPSRLLVGHATALYVWQWQESFTYFPRLIQNKYY
jgi:hypothetical protein